MVKTAVAPSSEDQDSDSSSSCSEPRTVQTIPPIDIFAINNASSTSGTAVEVNIDFGEPRKQFDKMFLAMEDKDKWKLNSGRTVEDILYKFGITCQVEQYAHFASKITFLFWFYRHW
jgi:hypothetical protein